MLVNQLVELISYEGEEENNILGIIYFSSTFYEPYFLQSR